MRYYAAVTYDRPGVMRYMKHHRVAVAQRAVRLLKGRRIVQLVTLRSRNGVWPSSLVLQDRERGRGSTVGIQLSALDYSNASRLNSSPTQPETRSSCSRTRSAYEIVHRDDALSF
jgi:hypothetical protein